MDMFFEGTVQLVEPVSGSALQPIQCLIEDPEFVGLSKWTSDGRFYDGSIIICKVEFSGGVLKVPFSESEFMFNVHASDLEQG